VFIFMCIYEYLYEYWMVYEVCEELIDVEDNF